MDPDKLLSSFKLLSPGLSCSFCPQLLVSPLLMSNVCQCCIQTGCTLSHPSVRSPLHQSLFQFFSAHKPFLCFPLTDSSCFCLSLSPSSKCLLTEKGQLVAGSSPGYITLNALHHRFRTLSVIFLCSAVQLPQLKLNHIQVYCIISLYLKQLCVW